MGDANSFDDSAKACLTRLIKQAFPHATFPDGPYARTADAILAQVAGNIPDAIAMASGLASLDAAAGGSFAEADDATADAIVAKATDAPFFVLVRATTVVTLYNDPEIWQVLGYEGASFDQGGYLHRGFDDLDWLPDPRIEEYDGPEELLVVAPGDEPARTEGER